MTDDLPDYTYTDSLGTTARIYTGAESLVFIQTTETDGYSHAASTLIGIPAVDVEGVALELLKAAGKDVTLLTKPKVTVENLGDGSLKVNGNVWDHPEATWRTYEADRLRQLNNALVHYSEAVAVLEFFEEQQVNLNDTRRVELLKTMNISEELLDGETKDKLDALLAAETEFIKVVEKKAKADKENKPPKPKEDPKAPVAPAPPAPPAEPVKPAPAPKEPKK